MCGLNRRSSAAGVWITIKIMIHAMNDTSPTGDDTVVGALLVWRALIWGRGCALREAKEGTGGVVGRGVTLPVGRRFVLGCFFLKTNKKKDYEARKRDPVCYG